MSLVLEIRKLYSLGKNSICSIGKFYNLNKYFISEILTYNIYPDIGLEYKNKITEIKNSKINWKKGKKYYNINENIKIEIKNLYLTGNYSMRFLGEKYGIERHVISQIIKNK